MKISKKTWKINDYQYDVDIIEMSGRHQFLFYASQVGNLAIATRIFYDPSRHLARYRITYGSSHIERYSSMDAKFVLQKVEAHVTKTVKSENLTTVKYEHFYDGCFGERIISFTTNI